MKQTIAYLVAETPPTHREDLSPGIQAAVAYIEANFAQPITLAELCQLAGLSLHRFVTVFRGQVGIPPHQFVCRTRISQARTLLRQGLPPAAVAVDTGFCDQSHLSRHFKRFVGTTPGSYLNSLDFFTQPTRPRTRRLTSGVGGLNASPCRTTLSSAVSATSARAGARC